MLIWSASAVVGTMNVSRMELNTESGLSTVFSVVDSKNFELFWTRFAPPSDPKNIKTNITLNKSTSAIPLPLSKRRAIIMPIYLF